MQSVRVRHYLERAGDFLKAMNSLQILGDCPNASALLGIHSAVSYSDALRVGLGDEQLFSEDHRNAPAALRLLLSARHMPDQNGVVQFQYLVSKKNLVAYSDRNISDAEYLKLVTKAERFAAWANKAGSQLRIEGWLDDDR